MYSSVLHVPCSRAKHVKKRRHSRFWDDIVQRPRCCCQGMDNIIPYGYYIVHGQGVGHVHENEIRNNARIIGRKYTGIKMADEHISAFRYRDCYQEQGF